MTWSTSEIQYEGLPLFLRKPDHPDIWACKDKFSQIVAIKHLLEKVLGNGLPDKAYNNSLTDFDHHMCTLLDNSEDGIIFLVETFGGKRSYYYYTLPDLNIDHLIETAKNTFKVNLKTIYKTDKEWNFLKTYPVRLFMS